MSGDPKFAKSWQIFSIRIFANLSPAEKNIALETDTNPSLQAMSKMFAKKYTRIFANLQLAPKKITLKIFNKSPIILKKQKAIYQVIVLK